MYDWKSQFANQRQDYFKRTVERLGAMDSMLNAVAQHPSDMAPIKELSQHFHQLAGSSAIYELDQLGEKAAEGEKICLGLLKNFEGVNKPDWKKMKDLVDVMRFQVSSHPEVAGGNVRFAANAPLQNSPAQPPSSANWSEEQRSSGGWAVTSISYTGVPTGFEKPKDILIVDGDQGNLMSLTRSMEELGMHVRGYFSTESAKKAMHERLPDALLLSIPLVDGPGYDVAQELRSLPDGHVPPILILSRKTGFIDKVCAIRCGADAFFDEIGDMSIITKKLQSLLERDKPSNYKILSVEDDPDQAAFIRGVLESVGYNVHSISDPRQFEEALLSVNPDLLLLDVMLGPVSGFELARFVRSDDRHITTPIIFLTTQNQLNAHVESARVGGDEHLIKPVAPQLLVASVAGRLERYRVLKKLIGRDGLTQFLTLSSFMEAAERILSKRYQGSGSMVLLIIDVDHMERINEMFGYSAGDKVLASLAKLLSKNMRNAEIFARIGGDEFAVIVDGIDDRQLSEIATTVINDFQAINYNAAGKVFNATISAGAAALDLDMDLKTWIANAQIALKSAKANGRNRVMKAKARTGQISRK